MAALWEKILLRNKGFLDAQLQQHLKHSDLSPADYSRASRRLLGAKVLKKNRIYLDMKYWVYCLDALIGKPQKPIHIDIARHLRLLVDGGQVICPAHYSLFCELFKQHNRQRRTQMAALVDYLSGGIAIQPPMNLLEVELLHMWRRFVHWEQTLCPLAQLVWQPIGNICGELVPDSPAFDPISNAALKKSHYDLMSVMPLTSLVEAAGEDKPPVWDDGEFQRRLTQEIKEHRHEFKTFQQVFMHEVAGMLDVIRPQLESMMKYLYEVEHGPVTGTEDPGGVARGVQLMANAIYNLVRLGKLSREFPSLHIGSGIHAATRYIQREFKRGDHHDHLHAKAALPYCQMFFTEKALGTLLTCTHLRFDEVYGCRILWDDEECLQALRRLA